MRARSLIQLFAVLTLALFAGLILRGLFVASTAKPPPQMAAVAVAPHPLSAGLLLSADDLAWRDIPVSSVTDTMIRKDSATAAKLPGAVIRTAVDEGTALSPRDVVLPDAQGFLAAVLAPGKRAVSVAVDEVTGNAGLTLPGDHVDLLLTQKIDRAGDPGQALQPVASETVLSDLRVIAVGSTLRATEGAEGASSGTQQHAARTVTLEVSPEDAERIAVATRLGQLSLMLRSLATPRVATAGPAALDDPTGQPVWGEDVSQAVRMIRDRQSPATRAPPKPQGPPSVRVFRGSNREAEAVSAALTAPAAPQVTAGPH